MALLAVFLLIGVLCGVQVQADDDPVLVVVGDSWGTFGGPILQKVLKAHGSNLVVKNYAIGGTTSTFWAREPDVLNIIVDDNPTTKYIWVSLGGNDVIDFMPNCTFELNITECINILLPMVMNNTRSIYDRVFAKHPEVKVVQFGYDIMNLAKNAFCRTLGFEALWGCDDVARCINPDFIKIQSLYVDRLAEIYEQVTAVNLLGSLQSAANVSGAAIGKPNLDQWSPAPLMMDNCIHPTNEPYNESAPCGFEIVFNNLWDLYFSKQTDIY